jgi:hypothetical protein
MFDARDGSEMRTREGVKLREGERRSECGCSRRLEETHSADRVDAEQAQLLHESKARVKVGCCVAEAENAR